MDPIASLAASGMRSRIDSLDMLANNLSNASTSGYKIDREFYSLYSSDEAPAAESGVTMPHVSKTWVDFSQGILTTTNNTLDFALNGTGLFSVQGPDGTLYTRNGSFQLNNDGTLITHDGFPVLGKGGSPIHLDPRTPVDVDETGTIRQNGNSVGQFEITEFTSTEQLSKHGGSYFQYDGEASGKKPAAHTETFQGKLENSNVASSEVAMRIVSVMRQFEMLQRAVTAAGEMDRKATEELAKLNG